MEPGTQEEHRPTRPLSPIEQKNYSALNLAFVIAMILSAIATLALLATKLGEYLEK